MFRSDVRSSRLAVVVVGTFASVSWSGSIVTADKPLTPGSPASATSASLSGARPIYALMRLDQPISELFFNRDKKTGAFDIDLHVAIDGKPSFTLSLKASKEAGAETSFAFPLSATPSEFGTDLKAARPASLMMKILSELPAGKHTIALEAAGRKPGLAGGSFSVDLSEADKSALKASFDGVGKALEDKKAALRTMPKAGGFSEAAELKALEAAVKKKYPTTVRVVVMSDAWEVTRDQRTKQILRRSLLSAWAKREGATCFQDRGWWAQEHLGGGKYDTSFRETSLVSTSAQAGRIDCDKVDQ